MNYDEPAPRYGWRSAAIAGAALAYVVVLGWLATLPPAFDSVTIRERIELAAQRLPAPIDPLPVLASSAHAELAMARDPMLID